MAGLIGKTIGKYELVERLGRGGTAAVYKAYQESLKRYVAVKIMHPKVANDETFAARFEREAHSMAALRHHNIVQVHDFGSDIGLSYLVMEYIEGPSLKQRLEALSDADELMPSSEVLRIVQGVASALDYAHAQGIIHRDVKPANIMLNADQGGDAVLTDFGLTRILNATSLTTSGILGTPEYLSPEQGEGNESDSRSDLYSLGIVLYEMLTGQTPFEGETPIGMILKHIQGELIPPRTFNPSLSDEVQAIVMKALARVPDDRYQLAGDMVAALDQAMSPQPLALPKTPVSPPAPPQSRSQQRGRLQQINRQELRRVVSDSSDLDQVVDLHLLIIEGAQKGQTIPIPLTDQVSLGRASGNTFRLNNAQVSRQHALIKIVANQIQLTDLNSTNGTFVNQKRVSTAYLSAGDYIRMGDVILLVQRSRT